MSLNKLQKQIDEYKRFTSKPIKEALQEEAEDMAYAELEEEDKYFKSAQFLEDTQDQYDHWRSLQSETI